MAEPSPTSERSSTRSVRRTGARFTRYWPSAPRTSRRATETSLKSSSVKLPASLSNTSSTSQCSARLRSAPPAKRTSSGFSARISEGVSDPAAHTTASAMFDLPEPFGPTITATPGSRDSSSASGNDLKPRMRMVFRCTGGAFSRCKRTWPRPCVQNWSGTTPRASSASRAASCSAAFLVDPRPIPSCAPATCAAHTNLRSCGGPCTSSTV